MPYPFTHGRPVRRARIRRIAAVPVLASLMLTGLAVPAGAADGPAALGTLAAPAPANPVQAAQLRAAATGRPVPVTSLSTETTTVTAQPNGSFVQDNYALPVQVKQHGAWTPVSATLHANPNGSYSPAATPTGVVLSGGGRGPLVTLSTPAGQSLSMTLPFTLPAPTVSGGTALYPSVLPGVDLQATVDNQGSFQEVLIVHNAAAAANPALRTLSVATSAHGLKVGTTAAGGLTATAPDGTVAFSGPAPVMWDSDNSATKAATPATAATAASPGRSTAAANGTADAVASSAAGPGAGAQVARVPMSDTSGTLKLVPDAGLLTAPPGGYPVYVDPPVTSRTGHFVQVYQAANCQTADTYDVAQDYNGVTGEGIGYVQPQWASGCDSGVEEAFYAINMDGIPKDAVVSSAVLTLTEVFGADGGCSNTWPVTVQTVSAISSATNWDNLPWAATGTPAYEKTEDISSANAGSSCGNKTQTWDGLQDAVGYVDGGMLTLGVYGETSTASTDYGHMRFSDDPYIQSTYDLYPTIADANTNPPAVTTNAQGDQVASPACGSGTPGWIGMTSSDNGSAVTMNATTTSPVGNNVATWFTMLDNMLSDGGKAKTVTQTNTTYQGSGTPASRPVSITLQDGHQYTWATQGSDGTLPSSTISGCTFDVDLTPPTTPTVTDSDFPPAGSGGTPKFAGTQSTFTFSSTDPAPDPTTCTLHACLPASGVAGFRYSLDQPIGGSSTHYVAANSSGVGTAPITPETWGTHILYVQAMDNAGNVSTIPSSYTFYAPWNPDTVVTAGDLTGDHVPDMLATSSDGDLILLPGNTDPGTPAATQIAGYPATSPDGTTTAPDGWNNFLIAHRGSLTNSGVDDLLAYSRTTGEMYMYGNDMGDGGTPGHFTLTADIHSLSRPPCTSTTRCTGYVQQPNPANPSSWGTITQMIAPGDLSGTAGSNQGNLITMEGGRLWLYQFSTGQYLLSNPILLGTGDWSNFTLIAPGVIGGNLNAATQTAGTPTLWARDNTTGSLYTFSLAKDANGNFPLLTPPTLSLTLPLTATDGTHMCADDSDSSTAAGNPIQIWECNKSDAQSWTMHTNGTISTIGGNCLDLTDATPVEGTHAELEPCNPALSTQQWTATATGQLKTANGLCLADPASDTTDNHTQLITWNCDNQSEQDWTGGVSPLTGTSQTGQPFPALTDPVGFGPNLPVAAYPQLASPGDKTGLGEPDLYATTPDGEMIDYPGGAPSSAGTATLGSPILQGAYSAATAWWELADGGTSTTAVDTIGGSTGPNTATLNGNATWTTDTSLTLGNPSLQQANPAGTVLSLDGTTGYAATSGPVVDTTGSFTVSLWANLNAGYNAADYYTVLGQRDATGARCGFYLQYSAAFKGWSLVMPGTDAANTPTYFHAGTDVTPHAGAWTHLVAVYDATTGGMSLYVNGQLAGTGTDTTPWAVPAGGPLLIGGADNGSNGNVADFPGKVSDLHVYNTALSPAAATSNRDNPPPLTGLN
jgi:hypothetical protein